MTEVDCSFTAEDKWFRLRACGILINNGKVLMIRNDRDPYYYSVGGGVQHGEAIEDAAIREVWEETGVNFEIERLAFIHENFFNGEKGGIFDGLVCHELAFYFLMKWRPECPIQDTGLTFDGLREHLVWLDIADLDQEDQVVYPEFFARELRELGNHPKHIVTKRS